MQFTNGSLEQTTRFTYFWGVVSADATDVRVKRVGGNHPETTPSDERAISNKKRPNYTPQPAP